MYKTWYKNVRILTIRCYYVKTMNALFDFIVTEVIVTHLLCFRLIKRWLNTAVSIVTSGHSCFHLVISHPEKTIYVLQISHPYHSFKLLDNYYNWNTIAMKYL